MGVNRLFIPQGLLDEWVDEGRATLDAGRLGVPEEGGVFLVEPAAHFLQEATGADDPHDLVGRVKEQRLIEALGAEVYMDSVVLGDNAYDVETGFVAVPEPIRAAGPDYARRPSRPDSDELAELLLKHLK